MGGGDPNKSDANLPAAVAVLQVLAWWCAFGLASCANYEFGNVVNGRGIAASPFTNLGVWFQDTGMFGGLRWHYVTLPLAALCVLALAVCKRTMTWKIAVGVGLAVGGAQSVMWMYFATVEKHMTPLSPGLGFYASRLIVETAGPMAAVAVARIGRLRDREIA